MSALDAPSKLTAAQHTLFLKALEDSATSPIDLKLQDIASKLDLPIEAIQVHAYKYFLKLQDSVMEVHGAIAPSPSLSLDLSSSASMQPQWTAEEDADMERYETSCSLQHILVPLTRQFTSR